VAGEDPERGDSAAVPGPVRAVPLRSGELTCSLPAGTSPESVSLGERPAKAQGEGEEGAKKGGGKKGHASTQRLRLPPPPPAAAAPLAAAALGAAKAEAAAAGGKGLLRLTAPPPLAQAAEVRRRLRLPGRAPRGLPGRSSSLPRRNCSASWTPQEGPQGPHIHGVQPVSAAQYCTVWTKTCVHGSVLYGPKLVYTVL